MPDSPVTSDAISIVADFRDSISFAAWQNSVPLLKALYVKNNSTHPNEDLTLHLSSTSGFLKPKQWKLDRLAAGAKIELSDRQVTLDPEYLSGLNESEKSIVHLSLKLERESNNGSEKKPAGATIAEFETEIRLLARDEWGGISSGGELLAAFVMPNDEAVAKILKSAAKILEQNGQPPQLDGYQSRDPKRAYVLVAAVWNAVCGLKLTYSSPPASFEKVGQKTRPPEKIISFGLATCWDTTLLFAAAIESLGLNAVAIFTEGHCFVGAWLVEKTLNQVVETDASEIRKAIAANELVTFETTLATNTPPARFENAVSAAQSATHDSSDRKFVAAIDIVRARMAQIRPLASHSKSTTIVATETSDIGLLPLAEAPTFDQLPAQISDDQPTTPSGRIDRWQRKLLDLSLRNRLLNFRSTLQTIPILCTDISKLEDLLSKNKKLKLISLPDQNPIGERDPELHRQQTDTDLDREFAASALNKNEVCCQLPTDQLDKRLVTLYRATRNDLAESGTNTLFLAVGFLRWRQKSSDSKTYRAPLLLVPIKMTRRSSQSPFHLQIHEDETRFNATLIQLLKQDFGKDFSQFESNLPRDEDGVDVPTVMQQVRQLVRDISGVEVIDECALSRFSFAKYLLWKDLVDRIGDLRNNRVVRHLLDGKDESFQHDGAPIPRPEDIDQQFQPAEIFHALDADSTQLAAVMAASADNDFVLIGPPGTGKSQTIANIISQCLATGKTTLFVAEKTAALDVVHRRLVQHGLGDCCVELHSNKAERKKFLTQLETNWNNNRRVPDNDWIEISSQLKLRRNQLNTYVNAINAVQPNGWTAFDAYWESARTNHFPDVKFDWPETVRHDHTAYQKLQAAVSNLGDSFIAVANDQPLPMVAATEWSVKWETDLLNQSDLLKSAARQFQPTLTQFTTAIGLVNVVDASVAHLDSLKILATAINECNGEDLRIMFHRQFSSLGSAVDELDAATAEHDSAMQSLSANYGDNLVRMPLDELEMQWRNAHASFWPVSWFRKRTVQRLLQTYVIDPSHGKANPTTDLAAIRIVREQASVIENSSLKDQTPHWQSTQTDTGRIRKQLQQAAKLRDAIKRVGSDHNATKEISTALMPLIAGKSNSLKTAAQQFVQHLSAFYVAVKAFGKSTGKLPLDKTTTAVCETSVSAANLVTANRVQLKRWTIWCGAKTKANSFGLSALIQHLESHAIAPHELSDCFRNAYARWFIPVLIDSTPILRTFEKHKHENAIADFCRLDAKARELASGKARRAIAHGLPKPTGVPRNSELGLLRHQMQLKRPSKSIRDVVSSMPDSFRKLAPCLLMSPLSIAQYLPANQPPFDVVIFDEASQITTWDAIGAIARGKQTIIVGDPQQLPPTNFFGKNEDEEWDDEMEAAEKDLESILDEAKASGLPELTLSWHYRSRHESLIAFSNYQYYQNRLITFPAADDNQKGVSLTIVPDSPYDAGKSRTNTNEAQAIVDEAVRQMTSELAQPPNQRRTFGVITFNMQQQSLIQDLFDQSLQKHPECEWYFSDDRLEPTVVKNLENVQGDERDVMFFSITFGPTASNPRISLNFGALNRDGGHRRLNVAITRARQQMLVYTSFSPEQLDAARSNSRGLNDLKKFLLFAAANGNIALDSQAQDSVGSFDSPFERAVSEALELRGWMLVPQIGVSGFRIDLGVKHPDKPGIYLAGIECDGATYHRSAAARDRDKTRQLVLEGLGWKILRIWSPDWWHDPIGVSARLDLQLKKLLEQDRSSIAQGTLE